MNRIGIIIPYFGKFPQWISLFIEGCRHNDFIDFIIFSDDNLNYCANNVIWHKTTFADYCSRVSTLLDINFTPSSPYKLCGLRPFYGYIHREELNVYDFWGFCDLDLVFGNLRGVFSNNNLVNFDIISTDWDRISGPLCIFRNNDYYRTIPFKIVHWQEMLISNEMIPLDEKYLSDIVARELKVLRGIDTRILRPILPLKWVKRIDIVIAKPIHFIMRKKRMLFQFCNCSPEIGESKMSYVYVNHSIYENSCNRDIPYLHFLFFKKNIYRKTYLWDENARLNTDNINYDMPVYIDKTGIHNDSF